MVRASAGNSLSEQFDEVSRDADAAGDSAVIRGRVKHRLRIWQRFDRLPEKNSTNDLK